MIRTAEETIRAIKQGLDGSQMKKNAALFIAKEFAEQNAWVSVEERLPEDSTLKLVYQEQEYEDNFEYSLAAYHAEEREWIDIDFSDNKVVFWRSLPPPPEVTG